MVSGGSYQFPFVVDGVLLVHHLRGGLADLVVGVVAGRRATGTA